MKRKPAVPKIKLAAKGAKNRHPLGFGAWPEYKNAPKYDDVHSSPELTARYVKEFCKLNHLKSQAVTDEETDRARYPK